MSLKRNTSEPLPILGYTTRRHLILDLDNSTLEKTIRISKLIMRDYNKVGDCVIMRSSKGSGKEYLRYTRMGRALRIYKRDNYHLVFDNGIGYNTSCRICAVLASIGILNKDYVRIREFRGDMTLRVSSSILLAGNKPVPVQVAYVHNPYTLRKDGWILYYLRCLNIARSLFSRGPLPKVVADQGRNRADHRREHGPVKLIIDRDDL